MTDENKNLETGTDQEQEEEVKTYTQEEVNKMLQAEGDKRVTAALKKQAEKFEKEKAEFEKLRDMDDAQKKEYEYNKRVEELEQKEKEFIITQNKLEASKVMSEHGLPISFVDYIVAEDAETMMANITAFEREWKAAVADAVQQRLATPAPKGSNVSQKGMSKEQFNKLTLAQQAEIYRTNPELYKQMTAR
jgi:NADH:ubiquinone oxidoreductase subunit